MSNTNTGKPAAETAGANKTKMTWAIAAIVLMLICGVLILAGNSGGGKVFPVFINEVLASNTSYPNEDGLCCDFIELYNSADYPVDLTGFQLGDIAGATRYGFPDGTVIDAHGYVVVYCDKLAEEVRYAPFGISRSGGESFYLIASNNAIVDSVVTLAMDADQPMIRIGTEEWGLSDHATPGQDNSSTGGQAVHNPTVSAIQITEISCVNTGYMDRYGLLADWVEFYNATSANVDISGYTLSDNVGNDKYVFPAGTVMYPGQYLVVYCSNDVEGENVAPFALSQYGGESVVLKNRSGMVAQLVNTIAMDGTGSMIPGNDGQWTVTQTPSPGFENNQTGYEAFLKTIGAEFGSVVISEVMSAAQLMLPDGFDEFPDWVELYNTTGMSVNLSGWFLSDDPAVPQKWEFPELEIGPGERVVVFCSGRDTVHNGQIHTGFSLASGGESLVLSSYLGVAVDAVTFGQASTNCSFVFDGSSPEPVLTSYPTPGYQNTDDGYELYCASMIPKGPLAIWEVMVSNDWYLPQALGACYDWVELRNISDFSIKLSDYSITDDTDVPAMYTLPDVELDSGESIVIILSGDEALTTKKYYHAGFSLNAKEDQLILYGKDGSLLDYVFLNDIPREYSYGRTEDSGGFFYMQPTPKKNNKDGSRMVSGMPASDIQAGIYVDQSSYTVPLSAAGTIYYTTDGSDPDTNSKEYEGPIQINKTTVLRAVAVENGKLKSDIYTATFVIEDPHDLPVVSLVTDPDNLWGNNGIYKNGDIDIKEEKRAANVAYTGDDGSFSIDCEISLHGVSTVLLRDKKSFSVRFQDSYGGRLSYDLFEDGEVTVFKSLILRAAHEDVFSTHIRDAMMCKIAADHCKTVSSQKYKYVALYINGEYWGLYALRELHSEEHFASYMEVPASGVQMARECSDPATTLNKLYNFAKKNNFKSKENYEYAKSIVDVSSFADWIILQAYAGNRDINGNMRYYYTATDGLWRCGLVDLDLGLFSHGAFDVVADTSHHGRIVKALMANEEFQKLLATRLAELVGGPLSDESMLNTINSMCDTIRTEVVRDGERWDYNLKNWDRVVDPLIKYCDGRAQEVINDFCAYVGFSSAEKTTYFGPLIR